MQDKNTDTEPTSTSQPEQLILKNRAVSLTWTYFGFSEDDTDQKEVKCKHCGKAVSAAKGNTTNLLRTCLSEND